HGVRTLRNLDEEQTPIEHPFLSARGRHCSCRALPVPVDVVLVLQDTGRHHCLAAKALLRADTAELPESLRGTGFPEIFHELDDRRRGVRRSVACARTASRLFDLTLRAKQACGIHPACAPDAR